MNAPQQALLAKARRSLAAARRLAADGDLDFAVSRAYYAMFYVAQAFLLGRGLRYSKHSAVIAAFGQEFAKSDEALREFHHAIVEAQDARTLGDYQIEVTYSADRFIRLAEQRGSHGTQVSGAGENRPAAG